MRTCGYQGTKQNLDRAALESRGTMTTNVDGQEVVTIRTRTACRAAVAVPVTDWHYALVQAVRVTFVGTRCRRIWSSGRRGSSSGEDRDAEERIEMWRIWSSGEERMELLNNSTMRETESCSRLEEKQCGGKEHTFNHLARTCHSIPTSHHHLLHSPLPAYFTVPEFSSLFDRACLTLYVRARNNRNWHCRWWTTNYQDRRYGVRAMNIQYPEVTGIYPVVFASNRPWECSPLPVRD